jgi:hypothetical protein
MKKFNYTFEQQVSDEDCPLENHGVCWDTERLCDGDLDERPEWCPLVEVGDEV